MFRTLKHSLIDWITKEPPPEGFPLCDFERIRHEVRPCDVLLIEGRSRVSNVIKQITQSPWTHSCIYIGRIHDIEDDALREKLTAHFDGSFNEPLVVEGYLGKGTIVSPLEMYRKDHIRICRPRGLSRKDAQQVISYSILQLGTQYNVRQIIDLARFLVPWSFIPGRWRSSLFSKHAGESTKTVCSTMIAQAFSSVEFPILPLIKKHEETGIELIQRNPKLFTPRDFDYSPFFEIIKYPFIELDELSTYRNLPWNRSGLISPDGQSIIDTSEITSSSQKVNQDTSQEITQETQIYQSEAVPSDLPYEPETVIETLVEENTATIETQEELVDEATAETDDDESTQKGILAKIKPPFASKQNKKISQG